MLLVQGVLWRGFCLLRKSAMGATRRARFLMDQARVLWCATDVGEVYGGDFPCYMSVVHVVLVHSRR